MVGYLSCKQVAAGSNPVTGSISLNAKSSRSTALNRGLGGASPLSDSMLS